MKILLTGSEGLIGKLIYEGLRKQYEIVGLDKKTGVDILSSDLERYFLGADALIHLAANPSTQIDEQEAAKNVEIARRVIDACDKTNSLKTIINASSINVYDIMNLFNNGQKITSDTRLNPNICEWSKGYYGKAKIEDGKSVV